MSGKRIVSKINSGIKDLCRDFSLLFRRRERFLLVKKAENNEDFQTQIIDRRLPK